MKQSPKKLIEARRERVNVILPLLQAAYPDAKCSLDFTTPLQLLVATMLSAQSTDKRVNIVTKDLFQKYRTPKDYAESPAGELEKDIQSTGFFNAKAKAIRGMAKALIELHRGQVPRTMDELHALPGVGRKTANVVLGNAFDINVGVTVDTHVTRLANRLGLTKHPSDAVKIEKDLIEIVPQKEWCQFSHLLIFHGRSVCIARKPLCAVCTLLPHCPAGPKFLKEYAKIAIKKKN